MSLTKSLHTVTAAVNVARFVMTTRQNVSVLTEAHALAAAALNVLGYKVGADYSKTDPTFLQIVQKVAALFGDA